jgi:deoxycytidine triphosphate deaminase
LRESGVLTGREIKQLGLVTDLDDDHLKAASCDLRLGPEIFVYGQGEPKFINLEKENLQGIAIEPFGMIIFSTREKMHLSEHKDIIGRFDLKIGQALEGLILQVGPQVEPGYEGPLFGVLLNSRGDPHTIILDQEFLTIEFSRISATPLDPLPKKKSIKSLQQFLIEDQHVDLDHLAKPSVIQNIRGNLRDCQYLHGLKIEGTDRIRTKQSLTWVKRTFWIATLALIVSIASLLFVLFGDQIRSWCNRRKAPEASSSLETPFNETQASCILPLLAQEGTGASALDQVPLSVVLDSHSTGEDDDNV